MDTFSLLITFGIILTTIEILFPSNFFVSSIGVSFILGAFFSIFSNNITLVILFISAVSLLFFFIMKRISSFNSEEPRYETNKDAYIGQKVKVQKALENNKVLVKIYSEIWMGSCEEKLLEEEFAIIKNIEGNTLILEKVVKNGN